MAYDKKAFEIVRQLSISEFLLELKKMEKEKFTNSRLWKLKKHSKKIIDILSNEIFRLTENEKKCKCDIEINMSTFNKVVDQVQQCRSNAIDSFLEKEDGFKDEIVGVIKINNIIINITNEGELKGYSENIIGFPFLKEHHNNKLKFIIKNRY